MPGPQFSDAEIVVEAPADAPRTVPASPMTKLLPILMIVAMAGMMVFLFSSGAPVMRNPTSLLFPVMMLVSTIGMFAYGGRGSHGAGEVDEGRKDYLRLLDRLRADVVGNARRQRESISWCHPDPAALWTLAGSPRMWERRSGDPDFCHVRVGVGRQRAAAMLKPSATGPVDQLEPVGAAAMRNFVRAHSAIDDLPIALALKRMPTILIEGEPPFVYGLVRAALCQLAAFHSPEPVAIAAVTSGRADREWDWLKWLPHHQHPHLTDACGPRRLHFRRLSDLSALPRPPLGHTVAIVDGGDVSGAEEFLTRDDVTILECGKQLDVDRRSLTLHVTRDTLAAVGSETEVFARPDFLSIEEAESCARRLAPYREACTEPGTSSGSWAQMLGVDDPGSLNTARAWQPRGPHDRLRVPVGARADGSCVELDLKESAENGMGPHGLCVGATGSGKSEFLRTLALGLIATHPPDTLNLVLVDFKGGATFAGFERARHVAALITNLSTEAHLVARMRDALAGEMNRRQELLRESGRFASVADYQKAREADSSLPPLPALLVIVDEFSELLSQHPEFAEMFVAIGRLGRSLRIHLLLATQRLDEGRLRGLESHLSYRICLKTFSPNESRAVIGVPDAFHLPSTPGAAFLRVGSEEPLAFQTAYVSATYRPPPRPPRTPAAVTVQRFTAVSTAAVDSGRVATAGLGNRLSDAVTVMDAVLGCVAGRGTTAHQVWLPPLSKSPTLDALLRRVSRQLDLTVPIGLIDKPFEQRRDPLLVELAGAGGHAAVIGAPQSGKSTALRTLVMALAATHSADKVQFYCIDLGGGSLMSLAALPHVGAVAGSDDGDLVRRTVAEVTSVLRAREASFRRLNVESMEDYRGRQAIGDPAVADDPYGDVFLMVDGWATLREEFETLESSISALAARGLSFGIHVVLTASRWAEIRPALKDQIGTRVELRLGDAGDSELNRKAAQHVPHAIPGRGITRAGEHMLIALPRLDGRCDTVALSAAIADAAAMFRTRNGQRVAPPVKLLPDRVDHSALVHRRVGAHLVVGLDEDRLEPVTLDFDEHQHVLVLGDNSCGKTAALRLLCTELIRTRTSEQAQLAIIDYRRSLLSVVESEHLAGYAISSASLAAQLPAWVETLRMRIPGPDVDQRQLRTRSWWSGPDMYLIVDDYDLVVAGMENPLDPVIALLPHARDLGLHVVVARRSGGAGRALFEPLLTRLRELGCLGVMMSASPDEGILLGGSRPAQLPPGRARLVIRAGEQVVQLGWVPPCP
ncbi:MAG: segregation ATPase FtsK/SpoIIIE, family [Mycobacterium sp.]|nr:segregation ATPase FtsK/SpoIIIE, family [Mycobacterium sp.]